MPWSKRALEYLDDQIVPNEPPAMVAAFKAAVNAWALTVQGTARKEFRELRFPVQVEVDGGNVTVVEHD